MPKRASTQVRRSAKPPLAGGPGPAPVAPPTVFARLAAIDGDGVPWIVTDAPPARPQRAQTVVAVGPEHVGREALVCLSGPERTPVVVGVLRAPGDEAPASPSLDLTVNRRRLVLAADEEIELRVGDARITLTADGKVVVRGADVVTSARRTNRIRGGAVGIN